MKTSHRYHNFDAIRLFAAATVIFSHSFLIADGHENNEPFVRLTGNIIGIHGVFVFLIISGFLVTQSLRSSASLREFAWKRFLRIYPALAVCAIVIAFIMAPPFSELGLRQYFFATYGEKYVAKVLLLYDVGEIPTVKFYDQQMQQLGYNPNGSLWTIASEIYCYIILLFLAAIELISVPIAIFGMIVGSVFLQVSLVRDLAVSDTAVNLFYTLPSFCAGVAMYLLHSRFGMSRTIAFGCVIGLVLAAPTGHLMVISPVLSAYPIIFLGLSKSIVLGNATRFGDLSYGTYLYGWPVEQVVRSLAGESLSGCGIFLISLPLAAACGWLSWHLIEKHALALKGLARRATPPDPVNRTPSTP